MTFISISKPLNILIAFLLILLVGLSGCQTLDANSVNSNSPSDEQPVSENPDSTDENKTIDNITNSMNLPRLEGNATVVMKINGRSVTIEVDGNNAPITAGNFVDLVKQGVYNGTMFHRVVTEPSPFVAQGGDPQSRNPSFPASRLGTGSYINPSTNTPRYIPLEIRPKYDDSKENAEIPDIVYSQTISQAPHLRHDYGVIAMARSQMPDSASAQFYFTLADLPFLDGSYAVFGRVIEGMDVVEGIKQGDRIESAEVVAGAENLKK